MRSAAIVLFLLAHPDEQPKTDPISDRLRFEIALAQRDYFAAAQRAEQLLAAAQAKVDEASRICAGLSMSFDLQKFACADKR